jgi:Putative prokaryotic signal transducing protein
MAYCPECLTEYREGSAECIDCRVPLQPGAPPPIERPELAPDSRLVSVRSFHGPTASLDAELARNVLKEEDIPCALPGNTGAEVIPGIDVVQLLVREEDAARAEEILKAFENSDAQLLESDSPQARESRGPGSQS